MKPSQEDRAELQKNDWLNNSQKNPGFILATAFFLMWNFYWYGSFLKDCQITGDQYKIRNVTAGKNSNNVERNMNFKLFQRGSLIYKRFQYTETPRIEASITQ